MALSDNGGAAEDPNRSLPGAVLGTRESYEGYGPAGAHVSSTPFRKTKKFTHEGGIAAPLIIHWPAGIAPALPTAAWGATQASPVEQSIPHGAVIGFMIPPPGPEFGGGAGRLDPAAFRCRGQG